jgi:hypothetical protein
MKIAPTVIFCGDKRRVVVYIVCPLPMPHDDAARKANRREERRISEKYGSFFA